MPIGDESGDSRTSRFDSSDVARVRWKHCWITRSERISAANRKIWNVWISSNWSFSWSCDIRGRQVELNKLSVTQRLHWMSRILPSNAGKVNENILASIDSCHKPVASFCIKPFDDSWKAWTFTTVTYCANIFRNNCLHLWFRVRRAWRWRVRMVTICQWKGWGSFCHPFFFNLKDKNLILLI